MKNIFKTGWWVAAAAVLVVIVVMGLLIRPGRVRLQGDGRNASSYGFDLSCNDVNEGPILAGGMPRDGLHAVDEVPTVAGSSVAAINEDERGKLLVSSDRVVGINFGGVARAYPLRLLRWHEVVNDTLGEVPLAVTYSGLSDAVAVWDRRLEGQVLTFGVSGLVRDSNTLIYDRPRDDRASSLWSQLSGRAAAGPAACDGAALEVLPCDVTTWQDWLSRHPDTDVMTPLPEFKRLYKRDPYHSYFGSDILHFPVDPLPQEPRPTLKDRVVIIDAGGERAVFALTDLVAAQESGIDGTPVEIGGARYRVHVTDSTDTAWTENSGPGTDRPGLRLAFWFAWHGQFPGEPVSAP